MKILIVRFLKQLVITFKIYISGQNEEILIFTKIMTPHFLRKMKQILTHIDTVDVMPCALQASNVGRIPELLGPRVQTRCTQKYQKVHSVTIFLLRWCNQENAKMGALYQVDGMPREFYKHNTAFPRLVDLNLGKISQINPTLNTNGMPSVLIIEA